MPTKTLCLRCGLRMTGEDWFGPPCTCEEPRFIGFPIPGQIDFQKEQEKFHQEQGAYQYPWAHEPAVGGDPRDLIRLAEQRYGSAFVMPIRIAMGILPEN